MRDVESCAPPTLPCNKCDLGSVYKKRHIGHHGPWMGYCVACKGKGFFVITESPSAQNVRLREALAMVRGWIEMADVSPVSLEEIELLIRNTLGENKS